jgi:hypothetical protein
MGQRIADSQLIYNVRLFALHNPVRTWKKPLVKRKLSQAEV